MKLITLGALGAGLFLAMNADEVGPGSDTTRGIRNNNPGNLENNGIRWQGLASRQTDPRFYQFQEPLWGIRALARTLKTYRDTHGLQTPREIISRWAPAFENNVDAYARAVGQAVGVDPDSPIPDDAGSRLKLVKAIIQHENGAQPYPDSLIRDGIRRAYT